MKLARAKIRLTAVVLAFGLAGGLGCTDDEGSVAEFCRVLSEPPVDSQWRDTDFLVFVNPEASDRQVEALRDEVERNPGVEEWTWVSQQEAYDAFVDLYEGQPEMVAAMRPEIMPASVRVRTLDRDPDAIGTIAQRFEDMAGVYRVVHRSGQVISVIDWHVRPLTSPFWLNSSAFTVGRAGIDLLGVAPPEMRDSARALEALWAEPWSASEPVQEEAVEAARQIAAFYDTECG